MVWAKTEHGIGGTGVSYINLDVLAGLTVVDISGLGTDWRLKTNTGITPYLAGSWSVEADAESALRELVDGVDPSTY